MRTRTRRVDLFDDTGMETEAGEHFYVVIPTSIPEGQLARGTPEELAERLKSDPDGRIGNARILDHIIEWNLTDEDGLPVPLTRSIRREDYNGPDPAASERAWHDARGAIVARVPTQVPLRVINEVLGRRKQAVAEDVAGN